MTKIKSLKLSEKNLKIKVEEMSDIINSLDLAKVERINLEADANFKQAENFESNSEIWRFIGDKERANHQNEAEDFVELSIVLRSMMQLFSSKKLLTKNEQKQLDLLERINDKAIAIKKLQLKRIELADNYEKFNKPSKDNPGDWVYIDSLRKYNIEFKIYGDSIRKFYSDRIDTITLEKQQLWVKFSSLGNK